MIVAADDRPARPLVTADLVVRDLIAVVRAASEAVDAGADSLCLRVEAAGPGGGSVASAAEALEAVVGLGVPVLLAAADPSEAAAGLRAGAAWVLVPSDVIARLRDDTPLDRVVVDAGDWPPDPTPAGLRWACSVDLESGAREAALATLALDGCSVVLTSDILTSDIRTSDIRTSEIRSTRRALDVAAALVTELVTDSVQR